MARDLNANIFTEVQKDRVLPVLFAKIQTSGGDMNVWTGGPESRVFNGDTYIGVGKLAGISPIKESSDLQANGMTLSLSGILSDLISISLDQIEQGLEATVWVGFLDTDTNALIADPYEIFTGITDIPVIIESGETSTIGIQCENKLVRLRSSKRMLYTPEDQKLIDANDQGFDFVALLQDKVIEFGPRENPEANQNLREQ